jgi:hypothetical protein
MAKEIISESRLREIISEEAARFKKKLTLEAEKKKLLNRLNEMYMEEMMDEAEEGAESVKVRPATEADVQGFLAAIKMTPDQVAQAVSQDSEAQDAISNPSGEAKQAATVAQNILKEYGLNEEDGQTVKENIGEFKIRFGKILKGLGLGSSVIGIVLAGIGWAVATGAIPGGFLLANPLVYSAALTFVLGIIKLIVGAKKVKKGYIELAANTVKDQNLLAYVNQFKQAADARAKGLVIQQIDKYLNGIADKAGIQGLLAADQRLGFVDTVKDMLSIPRSK